MKVNLRTTNFLTCSKFAKVMYFMILFGSFSYSAFGTTEIPEGIIARLNVHTFEGHSPEYRDFVTWFVAQSNISKYVEAFPGAKSENLKRALYIVPENTLAIPSLKLILEASGYFDLVDIIYSYEITSHDKGLEISLTECSSPESINDPGALATQHIENMKLPCAWSLTHGCPEISVGVVDVFFADNHPDLQGKFVEIQGECNLNLNICGHGYAVAGGIGAIVNNGICVAGAGYNTSLRGYCDGTSCNTCLPFPQMWPAYQGGNRVINVSCSNISSSQIFIDLVEEMTSNGVNLVVGAYGTGHSAYANIPGVINVAQLDVDGNFVQYHPNTLETNVDIGVPIINLWRLQSPLTADCGLGSGNSSMAASYISGVIALMLCANPCLTPAQIEQILKDTA